MTNERDISLSIVSHGQDALIVQLLCDIERHIPETPIILTHNLPKQPISTVPYKGVLELQNQAPKGFGANHNAAFENSGGKFFGVVNPDVRLELDPLHLLLECFDDPNVGLVAPRVINSSGMFENNARRFPSPTRLVSKIVGADQGLYDISGEKQPIAVDWVAGMFMLFRAEVFAELGGFNEDFFLYYEDVDICARIWRAGWKVMLDPRVSIVHDAQRTSHRKFRYAWWHAKSMALYFMKYRGRASRF